MADIQITVAQVQPPPPGKQKGSIKDVSGKYWFVWPQDMRSFVVGSTYIIQEYDTYNTQTGKTYYTIKRFQMVMGGAAGGAAPRAAPSPSEADGQRRLDIFVCGSFNNYLSNPNINPDTLTAMHVVEVLQKFKQGWMGVFGPSPLPSRQAQRQDSISSGPQREDDMNDDIPF